MTDQAHETPDPGTPPDGAAASGADEQAPHWFDHRPEQPDPAQDTAPAADAAHVGVEPLPDPRDRDELLEALHLAEQQRDEYLDDVRRARAEFENYRRRTTAEGAAQRIAGRADVAAGLLETLDDLQRTLDAAAASSDTTLAHGVELVASKLWTSLESLGMARIDATDVPFDPSVHEAVQHAPADESRDQPTVVEILRPGYRWEDRVLRAAMVVVEG